MDMVDRIRDTTESHDRCSVREVMGRHAGYLALNSGLAVGATSILLPEVDFNVERDVIERMRRTQKTGKKHFIIMVAEGVAESMKTQGINGVGELAKLIEQRTGVETRATVLGHVQRGGSPSLRIESWQARWALPQHFCLKKARATESSPCAKRRLLTTISTRLFQ